MNKLLAALLLVSCNATAGSYYDAFTPYGRVSSSNDIHHNLCNQEVDVMVMWKYDNAHQKHPRLTDIPDADYKMLDYPDKQRLIMRKCMDDDSVKAKAEQRASDNAAANERQRELRRKYNLD